MQRLRLGARQHSGTFRPDGIPCATLFRDAQSQLQYTYILAQTETIPSKLSPLDVLAVGFSSEVAE